MILRTESPERERRSNGSALVGIFVGGASRRMGFPKGEATLQGERIVVRVVRAAVALGEVVLVGRDPGYALELPRLDDAPGFEGPMGGFVALFRAAGERDAVALSCDLAHVDSVALAVLADPLPSGVDAAFGVRADGAPLEPFFARFAAARVLARLPSSPDAARSPQRFFRSLPHVLLRPASEATLVDWDTPDDVRRGGGRLPR